MSNDNRIFHRYMLTFQATFIAPNGQPSIKIVNTTVSRSKKTLPLKYIKTSQDSVAIQLTAFGIESDNIMDVSFLSSSYLGSMSEKEFTQGLSGNQASKADLYVESSDNTSENPFEIK